MERPAFESQQHVVLFARPLRVTSSPPDATTPQPAPTTDDFAYLSAVRDPSSGLISRLSVNAAISQLLHLRHPAPGCSQRSDRSSNDGSDSDSISSMLPEDSSIRRYDAGADGSAVTAYPDGSIYYSAPPDSLGFTGPAAAHAVGNGSWPYVSGCYVRPHLPLPSLYLRCDASFLSLSNDSDRSAASAEALLVRALYGERRSAPRAGGWVMIPVTNAPLDAGPDSSAASRCNALLFPIGTAFADNAHTARAVTAGVALLGALLLVLVSLLAPVGRHALRKAKAA